MLSLLTLPLFFSSRRRHTRLQGDWSSDVCSSDLLPPATLDGWPAAWAVVVEVGVEPELLDDDPPHAASSRTSDPNPAAAAHPVLRITSLHSKVHRFEPFPTRPETYQTAEPADGFLAAT